MLPLKKKKNVWPNDQLFGHLQMQGKCMKIADELIVGGKIMEELINNWLEVLEIFDEKNLMLSTQKTLILPSEYTLYEWRVTIKTSQTKDSA